MDGETKHSGWEMSRHPAVDRLWLKAGQHRGGRLSGPHLAYPFEQDKEETDMWHFNSTFDS